MSEPLASASPFAVPRATYRLQFNRAFTFRDAERLVPYLDALGVSHIYASPYVKAREGSAHGYDITDHNALNPEVGDEAAFDAFVACLQGRGMGHILDFVPNHMGIGKADNAWWLDVLEWGQASPYAPYFDIDWRPAKAGLKGKVLLPFLGDTYGAVLESGQLGLEFDRDEGTLSVWYFEHRFPIAPRHYARILERGVSRASELGAAPSGDLADVERLIAEFRTLRTADASARRRAQIRQRAEELKAELGCRARDDRGLRNVIEIAVKDFNGTAGDARSFKQLHRLLEAQAYRLAYWRVASDEINYRRFFNINDLGGIRMEIPEVFEVTHRLVFRLIAEGKLQGLRVDHIDGLFDPKQYAVRVQTRVGEILGSAPEDRPGDAARTAEAPLYLIVEKILAQHEHLRDDWPVAGTTGYEILNLINGLFVDPEGAHPLARVYRRLVGEEPRFDEVLYGAKKHVMESMLASELGVLANELSRIAEASWRTRDFTRNGLRDALKEVVACFPVYRTYVDSRGARADDRRDIDWAVSQARRRSDVPDGSIFDFVHAVLTTDLVRGRRSGFNRREVVRFAMKFQQYTGPVMAKGLEDTAFYRYPHLVSLNEVGGDPRRFGVSAAAFHRLTEERARRWPYAMIATSTHDTKRGEDVRARINVLSELADDWAGHVRRWARLNRSRKRVVDDAPAPAPIDEYLLYQTLVGSWPLELMEGAAADEAGLEPYRERVSAYMVKAAREAKLRSSWANPNEAYEQAVAEFVRHILDASRPNPFLADFLGFEERVARLGMVNGLAQTTLKLTVPGVPDFYRGSELWDLNLVDPDNRRAVDFEARMALLVELKRLLGSDGRPTAEPVRGLLERWPDGRVKLYLIWRLLDLRRRCPSLFLDGAYVALQAGGERGESICSFARTRGDAALIVAVPRLMARFPDEPAERLLGWAWHDTAVRCPAEFAGRAFHNVLTGKTVAPVAEGEGATVAAEELFADFPVAALVSGPAA